MDFREIKDNISTYLDKLYMGYDRNIESMKHFQNAQKLMELEQTKLDNYFYAILNDIKYKMEEELLKYYSYEEVEKLLAGRFNKQKIVPMHLVESQVMKKEQRIVVESYSNTNTSKEENRNLPLTSICMGVIGGAVVGGIIGVAIEKVVAGVAIGAVAGGSIAMLTSNNKATSNNSSSKQESIKEEPVKKVFDKEAFKKLLNERKSNVKAQIMNHINDLEEYYHTISRG